MSSRPMLPFVAIMTSTLVCVTGVYLLHKSLTQRSGYPHFCNLVDDTKFVSFH
jgi:hypothetical protein